MILRAAMQAGKPATQRNINMVATDRVNRIRIQRQAASGNLVVATGKYVYLLPVHRDSSLLAEVTGPTKDGAKR